MQSLWARIRNAIEEERYFISMHADEQCAERGIESWQLVAMIHEARIQQERPPSLPNPTVVVRQHLAGGEEVESVWAWSQRFRQALLVTAYLPD